MSATYPATTCLGDTQYDCSHRMFQGCTRVNPNSTTDKSCKCNDATNFEDAMDSSNKTGNCSCKTGFPYVSRDGYSCMETEASNGALAAVLVVVLVILAAVVAAVTVAIAKKRHQAQPLLRVETM